MNLKKLSIEEFVKAIKRAGESDSDYRYTLFLGAGCSKSSGIPTAGELVLKRWIPDQVSSGEDPIEWAKANIDGFDLNNPAASYEAVIERCFPNSRVRQAQIEQICEGASPGFGYSVVAQLCAQNNTPFSVVLTTNFDDLIADAMFLYAESRPLIIHHAALAEYIRPTRSRPMVVKVHGDARLAPKNTALETEEIEQALRQQVKKLLDDRGLLFFGYAGADNSVFNMLAELPSNALDLDVYWINEKLPAKPEFREWLKERKATWVRYTDFDEAMLHFYRAYNLAPPTKDRFDRIFDTWEGQFGALERQIDAKPDDEDKPQLMAETRAVRSSIDAWRSVNRILAMDKQDSDAILSAYQAAVSKYPEFAPLLNNYAAFFTDVRGDHDAAESFYKRAIDADPKEANILGNYANLLTDVRGDHDTAETFYKRAIDADPRHANNLGNYANLLTDVRGDHNAAQTFFKRAIETDPRHARNLGNYALFLTNIHGDHNAAETFFKRAIDADSKDAGILRNYANLLTDVRGDHDAAETFFKRAIDADPKDAGILNNYAVFLTNVRSNHDKAETFFKRAIDADPRHARNLSNYALFLNNVRGDHNAAETFYKRAIEADLKDASILGNYAIFLANVRGDHNAAESMFKRAIDADSRHANNFGNYGEFLLYRSEHERGFDFLDRSDKIAKDTGDFNRMAENDICRAIYSAGADRHAALSRLHRSLRAIKAPCPSWSQAERKRHLSAAAIEDRKWLEKLFDVSEGKARIDALDEWPEWQEASSDMRRR